MPVIGTRLQVGARRGPLDVRIEVAHGLLDPAPVERVDPRAHDLDVLLQRHPRSIARDKGAADRYTVASGAHISKQG